MLRHNTETNHNDSEKRTQVREEIIYIIPHAANLAKVLY